MQMGIQSSACIEAAALRPSAFIPRVFLFWEPLKKVNFLLIFPLRVRRGAATTYFGAQNKRRISSFLRGSGIWWGFYA